MSATANAALSVDDSNLPELVDSRIRYPALDGLRGVANVLVITTHLSRGFWPLGRLTQFGWISMDCFFVLSGFLITGLLADIRERNEFPKFYARRFLRVFPIYYLFLTICFLAPWLQFRVAAEGPFPSAIWFWSYAANFHIAWFSWTGSLTLDPTWSLSVEEQFYLLWPLLFIYLERRTVIRVCIALAALALLVRLVLIYTGTSPVAIYVLTITRMDSLAVGSLVALLGRQPGGLRKYERPARYVAAGLGSVFLVLWSTDIIFSTRLFHHYSYSIQTLGFTGSAVLFGALIAMLVTRTTRLSRMLSWRPFRFVGKHSYANYLIHIPAGQVVLMLLFPDGARTWPSRISFILISGALTMTLAWVLYHAYEKQFLKLGKTADSAPNRAQIPASEPAGLKQEN